jgi:hypothetical protein
MAAALAEEPGKDKFMATQMTVFTAGMAAAKAMPMSGQMKRRSINPEAGRALVILGHALEYLADEFINEGGSFTENRGQVDAIQLLISLNRQIYMDCPEVPTFRQWLRGFLHRQVKAPAAKREKLHSGLSHGRT